MAEQKSTALSPHYYLDNFLRLCDSVENQYGDLLRADEKTLLGDIRALPFDAQCLYVRLVSRTGPWFRESKLNYPEIASIEFALDGLLQQDIACEPDALDIDECAQLFTIAEMRGVFADRPELKSLRSKCDLVLAIDELGIEATRIPQMLSAVDKQRIVAPLHTELVELLQLLFFGNRFQNLTEFVLEDLGMVRYYPYRLDQSRRVFTRRAAVDEYLELAALADTQRELLEKDETGKLPQLARAVLQLDPVFPSSARRWDRLCNTLGRELERMACFDLASALYTRSAKHPARERRARIMEHCNELTRSRQLCEEMIANPWCEAERDAAERILPRLLRKLEGKSRRRSKDTFIDMSLVVEAGNDPVEIRSARKLEEQWLAVHYVENNLMNALFGLAFWEQIFEPVTGAFSHPYQAAPLDMYESNFQIRRAASLQQRLQELRVADLSILLTQAYQRYSPYQCIWVNWKTIDMELVRAAASVIPAQHLLSIWERILFDPKENRRGFPDLIALEGKAGKYCLIEVKGPGDALQDSQKRWLRFFQEQQIPAQVAWVTWPDD